MTSKERQEHRAKPVLPGSEGVEPTEAAANMAIDRWFEQQLTLLYNDVVNEPLPKEFLEIIGKIGKDRPLS